MDAFGLSASRPRRAPLVAILVGLAVGCRGAAVLGDSGADDTLAEHEIEVSLAVIEGCEFGSIVPGDYGTLEFGTHLLLDHSVDASATLALTVECTAAMDLQIVVDNGLHASGTQRRMKRNGGSDYVDYSLYTDSARTTPWDSTLGTQLVTTGAVQQIAVYGRIEAQPQLTQGVYTDTLQVTITY